MRNEVWLAKANSPLTTHPGDAGASPEWASVLAAVEALDDRASAPDGGVGRHDRC
jgi:hypothetical protein